MKTPSFNSLTSMLLFGALAGSQLTGCGMPGQAEDDDVSSASGALTRAAAVGDADLAAGLIDHHALRASEHLRTRLAEVLATS